MEVDGNNGADQYNSNNNIKHLILHTCGIYERMLANDCSIMTDLENKY